MIGRLTFAVLLSSIVAALCISGCLFLAGTMAAQDYFHWYAHLWELAFPLIFGWPIALAATAGVGVPGYLLLQRGRVGVQKRTVVLLAAIAGAVCFVAFWRWFSSGFTDWWFNAAIGAAGGAPAGACFWSAARDRSADLSV